MKIIIGDYEGNYIDHFDNGKWEDINKYIDKCFKENFYHAIQIEKGGQEYDYIITALESTTAHAFRLWHEEEGLDLGYFTSKTLLIYYILSNSNRFLDYFNDNKEEFHKWVAYIQGFNFNDDNKHCEYYALNVDRIQIIGG